MQDRKDIRKYVPNDVPKEVRRANAFLALYLLAWGGWGLYRNGIVLSVKGSVITQLRNGPAWLMVGAFVCGALVLLSVVVDHYDRRPNEASYRAFRWIVVRLGWCLFAASLVSHLILFFSGARM